MKHTPVPEIIADQIEAAINIPGLQHIVMSVATFSMGDGNVDDAGTIKFWVGDQPTGVSLRINADKSMALRFPDEPCAQSWTADEVTPEKIKAAVIDALRAVVRAAA